MKILAIDTSCDETCAAVTQGARVLSNVIWSQASAHANFGGVMPSLAQRMHKERIDWVVARAMNDAKCTMNNLGAIAVTAGPGLAIALEVGIAKAKEIAQKHNLPLMPINHLEGHLLSPLARRDSFFIPHPSPSPTLREGNIYGISFPAFGLVISGGHTELVEISRIGKYRILAKTTDDALGEALDKAARMLGLGYPGGAILEKMAREGDAKTYPLPLPMARSTDKSSFSYSGLKTALYRLVQQIQNSNTQITKTDVCDLAATFQNRAFQHLERVINNTLSSSPLNLSQARVCAVRGRSPESGVLTVKDLLVGGGVAANIELRRRLRKMGKGLGLNVRFPYSTKLVGDNAAMIGVAAGLRIEFIHEGLNTKSDEIDRIPRWSVEEV
jgi:N6-L-threonylcarbamoyladenine synthase